ncbi:MAG: hypothetical protein ACREA2_17155 [Blastocatellia bacterium]
MKTRANDRGQQDTGYGRVISAAAQTLWEMGAGSVYYDLDTIDEALFQVIECQHQNVDRPLEEKIETISGLVPPARDFIMAELHSISTLAYVALIEMAIEVAPQRALKRAGMPYKDFKPIKQRLRDRADLFLIKWMDYLEEKMQVEMRDARGGARRKPRQKVTAQLKRDFAVRVDALRPLWEFIIQFFESNDYEAECPAMLRQSERFKTIVAQTGNPPATLIRKVFRRKRYFEDGEEMPRNLQPRSFMVAQAADEMGLSYDLEQLRKFYGAGRKKSKASE